MKDREKICVSVRLTEEEKQKVETCAERCGLSRSEFLRQLCRGQETKRKPPRAFWEMLNALYFVHNAFAEHAKYEPSAVRICREIECLVLRLQEAG